MALTDLYQGCDGNSSHILNISNASISQTLHYFWMPLLNCHQTSKFFLYFTTHSSTLKCIFQINTIRIYSHSKSPSIDFPPFEKCQLFETLLTFAFAIAFTNFQVVFSHSIFLSIYLSLPSQTKHTQNCQHFIKLSVALCMWFSNLYLGFVSL